MPWAWGGSPPQTCATLRRMNSTLAQDYERLRLAVLETAGTTEPGLRAEVEARAASLSGREAVQEPEPASLSEPLGSYVDKLALHAYRVVDADIAGLLRAGYSEDAVFEVTLAAALGAAAARYERANDVLADLP